MTDSRPAWARTHCENEVCKQPLPADARADARYCSRRCRRHMQYIRKMRRLNVQGY